MTTRNWGRNVPMCHLYTTVTVYLFRSLLEDMTYMLIYLLLIFFYLTQDCMNLNNITNMLVSVPTGAGQWLNIYICFCVKGFLFLLLKKSNVNNGSFVCLFSHILFKSFSKEAVLTWCFVYLYKADTAGQRLMTLQFNLSEQDSCQFHWKTRKKQYTE